MMTRFSTDESGNDPQEQHSQLTLPPAKLQKVERPGLLLQPSGSSHDMYQVWFRFKSQTCIGAPGQARHCQVRSLKPPIWHSVKVDDLWLVGASANLQYR
jgi:hypothetical protein